MSRAAALAAPPADALPEAAAAPLRILMLCPQFRPLVGGYERAAERLAIELAGRGHHVEVVAERRERAWPAEEVLQGVRVRRLPCVFRRRVHTATAVASLLPWLASRRGDFDVLHAHQYSPQSGAALALARRFGWRTVLKLISSQGGGIAAQLEGGGWGWETVRRWHRGVDAVVVPSQHVRAEAARFGIDAGRIHLVPNGVDTAALAPADPAARPALRRRLGLGEGPVVVCVGRLSAEKGPLLLARAWQTVAARVPQATLVFVGDGPERAALEAAAGPSVRVVGEVDDPAPWYRAADLFVLPSLFEGLSNTLIEAMSCGLPVVSTAVSGSVDLFARAPLGEMVPPGDPDALADGLLRLLGDPERRRACGAAARALAVRDLSLGGVAAAMEGVYRGAAAPAHGDR